MPGVHDNIELAKLIAEATDRLLDGSPEGFSLAAPRSAQDLASLIDHTLLKPTATRTQVQQLCAEAAEYGFAAVCVNPIWVALCANALSGSHTVVCSVIGFPLGATTTDVKVYEARHCTGAGARELDMVINIGALQSGEYASVYSDIAAVAEAAHAAAGTLKVIIETAYLNEHEKIAASAMAKAAGADFVKTSTGFGPGGATIEDVALMRRVVGPTTGVKAAGGVRTLADVNAMVAAGASRIGSSSSVSIMQEAHELYGQPTGRS
jgi:deoxyribose-phosphate aldolase